MLTLSDFERLDPVPSEVLPTLKKILESANLFRYSGAAEDSETSLLERDFAKYVGTKYALAVSSCSSAIFLSLLSAGVKPGDKVLMPGFTFTAVPSSIVHAGGVPILVECTENYCVDLADLEKKAETTGAKFLVLSHMRGHTADIDSVLRIAEAHGITVIEDAAHSLGALWNGKRVGTFGTTGCYSFQSFKIINAGEGGMLVTDDEEIIVKAIFYSGAFDRVWAKHLLTSDLFEKYQNTLPIYNMRMSNVAAAIVRPQLDLINEKVATYNLNYTYLTKILSTSPHIYIPKRDPRERCSPDSIQFGLIGATTEQATRFMNLARSLGLGLNVFGVDKDNARVFWNWKFLNQSPHLPITRDVLMRSCDMRLPIFFEERHLDYAGSTIVRALGEVMGNDPIRRA